MKTMKNLKVLVFTLAIITMATISSYAQSKDDGKTEKFMLVFRGGDTHPQNANSKEAKEYIQSWITWMQDLGQKGILAGGENLERTGKQVSGKSKVVTDGPFIQDKEMINGYLIINAKDINEAVEIAKGCPIFKENGKVEVRQVHKLDN
ncbi:YciI family protein [Flavobacterium sp.]|uniref:YciI family protein n=1 Tax=Flavobacterium sp. TaxID=239 RepID=UPI002634FF9E|nr:YciI family protein [Flavobacterium sp.]